MSFYIDIIFSSEIYLAADVTDADTKVKVDSFYGCSVFTVAHC